MCMCLSVTVVQAQGTLHTYMYSFQRVVLLQTDGVRSL